MVDFLNDNIAFEGDLVSRGELLAEGVLTIGAAGQRFGESVAVGSGSWQAHTRVHVADETERAALVAWRAANAPISPTAPLLIWRANGSLTGVDEITVNGVDWCAQSPLSGDVEMTIADTAPYGWLLMQGQLLANADVNYPALWAAASPTLRVGSSLQIPDFRGRVPMGAGQGVGLTLRNLGDQVGSELATLSVANLPAHNHTASTDTEPDHTHTTTTWGRMNGGALDTGAAFVRHTSVGATSTYNMVSTGGGAHSHAVTVNNTGSGTGHANVQPSLALNLKVKV